MDARNNARDSLRGSDPDDLDAAASNPNVFDDEFAVDDDADDAGTTAHADAADAADDANTTDPTPAEPSILPRRSTSTRLSESALRRTAFRNSLSKTPARNRPPAAAATATATATATAAAAAAAASAAPAATPPQRHISISSTGSFATAQSDPPFAAGPSHPYGMYPQNTTVRSSITRSPSSGLRPSHPYAAFPQATLPDGNTAAGIPIGFPGLASAYNRRIGPDGEEQDIIGVDGHAEQLPPYTRYPEAAATRPPPPSASAASAASPTDSTARLRSDNPAQPPATNDAPLSEKADPQPGFKAWCRRRILGRVPAGVVLVLLVLILILAVVLGAAIGTIVANARSSHHHKDNATQSQPVDITSTLIDATPIPTPSDLRSLPQGTYQLPLGIAQESNPNCIRSPDQLSAWSCNLPPMPVQLNIFPPNASMPQGQAALSTAPTGWSALQYGLQPPRLSFQPLTLVADANEPSRGPAFHFQTPHDKIVVLSLSDFAAGNGLRRDAPPPNGGFGGRFQVQQGDVFWFCQWNATSIEAFIYTQDNASLPSVILSATGPPPSTLPPSSPSAMATSTASNPVRRDSDSSPSLFPLVVKIDERRLPGAPPGVCYKSQLHPDGSLAFLYNPDGQPIAVNLTESDPSLASYYSATLAAPSGGPSNHRNRRDPSNACSCQWMYQ